MAGIYIHIPFCKKACHYCNFHFSTSLALKGGFLDALLKEIEIVSGSSSFPGNTTNYLANEPVETIYLGGGTPSLLTAEELNTILAKVFSSFAVTSDAEITLEANPDDISAEKLKEWKAAGINRLSIGVQSFYDSELRWMNRAHNAAQSVYSIETARNEGFDNITIDLIYGTPGLSDDQWQLTVQRAIEMNIPHLSCYALTVEPSTALRHMIDNKQSADTDPEKQASQFTQLMNMTEAAGYVHYEISNFAKPGMQSRHNRAYWQGKHYAGLGPSAHSFNGVSRQWNVANNALYISSLQNNVLPSEIEMLTGTQQLNEYIMTSLRTAEGLDLVHVQHKYGEKAVKHIDAISMKYRNSGKVNMNQGTLQLTKEGKLFADGIAADMFLGY